MALTTAFLNTCRDAINDLAELTAFRAARAIVQSGTRQDRIAAWHAAYTPDINGESPIGNLRKAIRDTVNAQADSDGSLGPLDRESAYRTLAAEFAPQADRPKTDAEEADQLETLLREDQLS